jgi:SAM-dependent methyltransferase
LAIAITKPVRVNRRESFGEKTLGLVAGKLNLMNAEEAKRLYKNRKLSLGYPELEKLGVSAFTNTQSKETNAPRIVRYIEEVMDLPAGLNSVAVVGCGPHPVSTKELLDLGYDAVGIEPVADYVKGGQEWIGATDRIKQGNAEKLPLADESQAIVLLESVLEHVDSPIKSVQEAYRVLAPGGAAYIQTTNRYRISLTGDNGEYSVPFLNWMPGLVKEAFVHHHLHFNPKLANYTPRPAYHWFSYPDLCKLGRDAGFYQFYSKLDLIAPDDPALSRGGLRAKLLNGFRYNPWLRSIALAQFGDSIFMLKRPAQG